MTMVTTRTVPWMKLGNILDQDVMTSEEAIKLGGMDFTVSKQPALRKLADGTIEESNSRFWVVRDDTEEAFDIVSHDYELLQYADTFAFLDEINPDFVAAGTLKGGKQGFVVVQAPEASTMRLFGEDPHDMYIVVRTSHDRSRAVEAMMMPLRGKCMNQLGLQSFKIGVENRWSIPHVSTMHDKLILAQDMIKRHDLYTEQFEIVATQLVETTLDNDRGQKLIRQMLGKHKPKTDETVDRIMDLWNYGETVGYAGTGWGLVNAVSDYYEHGRTGGNNESRFTAALQGVTYQAVNRMASALMLAA